MTRKTYQYQYKRWHRIGLLTVLCLFALSLAVSAARQRKRTRAKTDDRIHLVHADELRYNQFGVNPGAQIVKGRVHFTHQGSQLWCDSAYFYQNSNSVKAFGHVRYKDGDTLTLTCNRAAYDGMAQMLTARQNVVLKHRRQTLYCDSLNFNRIENYAYFFEGGKLVDGKDKLVSDWGGYRPDKRLAEFYYKVHMYNGTRDIHTDTLYYDIAKSIAHVLGPSTIKNKETTVKTSNAWFDSRTDYSRMYSRSTIIDKNREITGDSLFHDDKTGQSRAFGNVIYTDSYNKNELHCGHLEYNDQTGYGFAAQQPLAIDYSQKDTLWVHSDTMKVFTYYINTDSVYRVVRAFANVRAFRNDLQAICGLLVGNSKDSCATMLEDPIVWSDNRQLFGDSIKIYMNDSTVRQVEVLGQSFSVEKYDDKDHYNQVSSRYMVADFIDGDIRRTTNIGNVRTIYYPIDDKDTTMIGMDYQETDTMDMYISAERKLQKIVCSKTIGTLYPMTQIPPGKTRLQGFQWFAELRPKDKNDLYREAHKSEDQKLKVTERKAAPLQTL
ncbi:MAG: OstA-like protein [Prevotella sp.]|jgi:hypothetical protein